MFTKINYTSLDKGGVLYFFSTFQIVTKNFNMGIPHFDPERLGQSSVSAILLTK